MKDRVKIFSNNTVIKMDGIGVGPGDIIVGDGDRLHPHRGCEKSLGHGPKMDPQDKQAVEEIQQGLSFTEAPRKYAKIY